jgi:Tfp pilus assembly protein PilN
MNISSKTALGVNISENQINLVLLRQSAKGIELTKTATGPVPDGAIKNGNIEDPVALARAIKELKKHNRIHARQAAISLSVKPIIAQILDIPKGIPKNIGQFVRNELKSYVSLSGKEIASDFCGIKGGRKAGGRLFAVATDKQQVADLVEACIRAQLNLEVIEPPLLAYIRTIYSEKIKGRFDSNVLIAILYDNNLALCVFRKENLDFIRVEDIGEEKSDPNKLCRWLGEQINMVTRFYEVEITDSLAKWEVTVIADHMQLPNDADKYLEDEILNASLDIRTDENAYKDVLVKKNNHMVKPSLPAIGLAMRLLNLYDTDLKINLVPPESADVKSVKKQLLITTVIIVLVPILMELAGSWLSKMADKTKTVITQRKQTEIQKDTYMLLNEQQTLKEQIKEVSEKPNQLNNLLKSRYEVDWANILNDVKKCTPKTVRITKLYNNDNSGMRLEGQALSYESVRLFVNMLNKSDYINSASLTETMKDEESEGLVMYIINCSLNTEKSNS